MNILYIAFSCQPNKGSEEKIGWSIPLESSKNNNVFVVTREEQRAKIEDYVIQHKLDNIKFYYADINPFYKKIFKGPMFSLRLNLLHKKAYPLVKEICKQEHIDVIHQITPIEFRSIGNYSKIENTKFVCGPLGGAEYMPKALKCYAKGNKVAELFRKCLNSWSRFKYRITKKLSKCDYILFANKETAQYLSFLTEDVKTSLITEIGVSASDIVKDDKKHSDYDDDKFRILVAGRLNYRKGHLFLLDALKELKTRDFECRFVGEGPMEKQLKERVKEYELSDKVVFCGRITYDEMLEEYKKANIFVMPSLRETTGTVLLESMSNALPVVTLKNFGALNLLDDDSAWFVDGESTDEYICNLKNAISECMTKPQEVIKRGSKAKQMANNHTWDKKVGFYQSIYDSMVEN